MTISQQLQKDLETVLSGDPWYGSNVYDIIAQVSFEAAFETIMSNRLKIEVNHTAHDSFIAAKKQIIPMKTRPVRYITLPV